MLKALANIFSGLAGEQTQASAEVRDHDLRLATALLLVEIARADHKLEAAEQAAIAELLGARFILSEDEIGALVSQAEEVADHAASFQAFTRQLNEEITAEEKLQIVEMLWQVAFADNELSKYEDSLVRKLCDLLYVSHRDVIRIRNRVVLEL